MIDALRRVSLMLEIRFCYYCRLTVINCYCSGKGPYEVVEVVKRMDYKIDVNGVVSTYHANMLKQYVERRNELSHCLLSAEAIFFCIVVLRPR